MNPTAPNPLETLRLAVLQLDPEQAPSLAELPGRLEELVRQGAQAILLPEFWNTAFEGGRLARGALSGEDGLAPLLEWSTRHPRLLLCPGSLPVRLADGDGPRLVNRSWLIQDGAIRLRYDKLHLFGPLGEPAWVRPGGRPALAELGLEGGSLRVGLAICYDLRFPELFRDLAARGAELILLPAQWPRARHFAFHHLLRARALENGISVAGVNRLGRSGGTDFDGGSAAYGMGDGQVFLEPLYGRESSLVELDLAGVRRERAKLDAVADRRYRLTLEPGTPPLTGGPAPR
ncbi:MAG: nitrilase-related carbon-nitrogen hydrolase [Candidatus Delongbacteria bacterium]